MLTRFRTASAVAILALTASLAVGPAAVESATAATAPAAPERTSVTAECAAAQSAWATARANKAKAHRKVVKAKKALRKAKHTHRPAKIRKAKRHLKAAKRRYVNRTHQEQLQHARVSYACSAPTSTPRATGTGMKIDILTMATSSLTQLLDPTQLTALLEQLLPGITGQLSPTQLTALLGGVNSGPLSLDDATVLLGGTFTPDQLQSLLAGTASPDLVLGLIDEIVGQLSSMGGGFPIPAGAFDPTGLFELLAGMSGGLDPTQLGGLLDLLLTAAGQGGTTLDATQLTDLLDALIPGLSSLLDPSQLTDMLTAVNGGSLDASTLANLLGGQFSAAQIQQVLDGTASTDLTGAVLGNVLAQLGTIGGGGLVLPGSLDATALLNLVNSVTTLVSDLLGGTLGGGGGGLVCTLLPILC